MVLYLEASDETMKERLMKRSLSSGRADDNEATILNRLEVFHQVTGPVVEHYEIVEKLKRVDADRDPEDVFDEIKNLLHEHNEYIGKFKSTETFCYCVNLPNSIPNSKQSKLF